MRLLVETRQNLAEGIEYIKDNQDKISQVVVPDEGLQDSKEALAQKALISNEAKAKRKRTMEWNDLRAYLPLVQCNDVTVVPLSAFRITESVDRSVILLLQNDADIQYAMELQLLGKELFSYSHFNTNNIIICHFKQTGLTD